MALFSPGFRGRRSSPDVPLPPGQYLTEVFPVLSAVPTRRIPTDQWEFVITTEISQEHRWSWSEMLALPSETPTVDIHCVTRWSKLGTSWQGVSLDTLFADVDTASDYAMIHSYGGYTANMPAQAVLQGQASPVDQVAGGDLGAGPGRRARRPVTTLALVSDPVQR